VIWRAREDAVNARTQARHQLKGFLLRRSVRYGGGKSAWSKTYYRWLGTLNFEHPGARDGIYRVLAGGAKRR
jgi:hypothetical protein